MMDASSARAADIIVNKTVPIAQHTLADTRAIFAMRKRVWPNGKQIIVFSLSDSSSTHKDFVKNNLRIFPHQLRRVWDRLIFAGTGEAPIQLDSEQDMIDKIANTPDSIGYIQNKPPENEKIRLFEYQ
jgi:ABC-type phosphate transport system substrate-binding protein